MNKKSNSAHVVIENEPENQAINDLSKRHFLRGLTAIVGGTLVAQFASNNALAAAFNYQAKSNSSASAGQLFSKLQMKILHDICDVVLPKTDTPSAAELDVHGFVDHQLSVCYDSVEQDGVIAIVDKINTISIKSLSQGYIDLSSSQQKALLESLEKMTSGFNVEDKAHFKFLKSLIVFGYFTTEVGATQALNYQAVPGGFKGSVPYSTLKKSWGSLAYY